MDFSGSDGWDPSLAAVLGMGVAVTSIGFHALHHFDSAVVLTTTPTTLGTSPGSPLKMGTCAKENCRLDWKLFTGSALFGVGWGLCGLCPGPALVTAGAMAPAAAIFLPSMFVGMVIQELLSQHI